MSHTPGPWEIKGPMLADHNAFAVLGKNDNPLTSGVPIVAKVYSALGSGKSNACLIAAAPELLEEVKRYRSLASDTEKFSEAKRRELDDLILRAEGRK